MLKQKARRSKSDVNLLKSEIYDILKDDHPMTVRQVFYQLVVRGIIDKTELEYRVAVIRPLTYMRISGEIPYHWIIDESRRTRITRTFDNVADAIAQTAKFYRRSAMQECDAYIEIWCEKEALSGIVALTEEQIRRFRLPTRPTKREGNAHAKRFAGDSTELDRQAADHRPRAICRFALTRVRT